MPKITIGDITFELEVLCSCGEGLCRQTNVRYTRVGVPYIIVEPCPKCTIEKEA